ncbi:MAG TPA: hypothetical protein ENJ80_11000 [Gammaproteobacteria bacterium]|nr:hypothetical protein [Gammaproteobacteria bacterium]
MKKQIIPFCAMLVGGFQYNVMAASITVGYLSGSVGSAEEQVGNIVAPIVSNAAAQLNIDILTSDVLDANFFSSIDVFVFANAQGSFQYNFGGTNRRNLLDFVNNGGTAYLGLDRLQDGAAIAADFGFVVSSTEYYAIGNVTSTITDLSHPIASGPFLPAETFLNSYFGVFAGDAPANGTYLGSNSFGNVLGYRQLGLGEVYVFTDEAPLFGGPGASAYDNNRLFMNVLVDAGASMVPAPAAAWLFGTGMLTLAATARRRKTGSY